MNPMIGVYLPIFDFPFWMTIPTLKVRLATYRRLHVDGLFGLAHGAHRTHHTLGSLEFQHLHAEIPMEK